MIRSGMRRQETFMTFLEPGYLCTEDGHRIYLNCELIVAIVFLHFGRWRGLPSVLIPASPASYPHAGVDDDGQQAEDHAQVGARLV